MRFDTVTRGPAGQLVRASAMPMVQTKLLVGPAGDRYEREADQAAEAVMRSLRNRPGPTGSPKFTGGVPGVSRKIESTGRSRGGASLDAGSEAVIHRARSGGTPLQPAVRSRMEATFGHDFSTVRLHQGTEADRLNRQLQARACTVGTDIFLARNAYRPDSLAGQQLLGHELAHVVQQTAPRRIRCAPDRPVANEPVANGNDSPVVHLRHAGGAVQRAILAIDGAGDDATALQATRNCLDNLKTHKQLPTSTGKQVQHYPAGDARGQVFGPAAAVPALADLTKDSSKIGAFETLYFLGHGSTKDIAGLTPSDLATRLVTAFAGYPSTFIGAFKIVACYSASTLEDGKPAPSGKSFADRLRTELDTKSSPKFHPRFVEGTRGIAWVDEDTGQRVGYEVLGERLGELSPLEQVYTRSGPLKKWFAALKDTNPATRKAGMDAVLQEMHTGLGSKLPAATQRRVLGKTARERYPSRAVSSDFKAAAKQLALASEKLPPDKALAETALKRMKFDWAAMDSTERKEMRSTAASADEAYLWQFEKRRPSWQVILERWVI